MKKDENSVVYGEVVTSELYQSLHRGVFDSKEPVPMPPSPKTRNPCCKTAENLTQIAKPISPKSQKNQHSKKPLGIMQNHLHKQLKLYKQNFNGKPSDKARICKMKFYHNEAQLTREKPTINKKSQQLYEKRKQERSLSPNVFERLKIYEEEHSKEKIHKTINRIKQVSPNKKITEQIISQFTTPREFRYVKQLYKHDRESGL